MIQELGYSDHLSELIFQARLCWAVAGLTLVLLFVFGVWSGRRLSSRSDASASARSLLESLILMHRSESATASLEFLLVLFPFLFIVMTVWQLAFMFNAQLYVGYAAYAAARSAAVMIPAEVTDNKGNKLKVIEAAGMLKNEMTPGAQKWRRIRRAAIVGTLPISPGEAQTALGVMATAKSKSLFKDEKLPEPTADLSAATGRLLLMGAHYLMDNKPPLLQGTRIGRTSVKSIYADNLTSVFINGTDHRGGDGKGQNVVAELRDLSDVDTVSVAVHYVFWLQVPYVGRMMELTFEGVPKALGELLVNPYPSMTLSETVTMKSWLRKRATEPCG